LAVVSYRKAVQLVNDRFEYGDPLGALQSALAELDKVLSKKRDADWHHLRGLCHYDLEEPDLAEAEFRLALQADSKHSWADLYLGHALFDREEYSQALVHFLRADELRFAELGQDWRIVKNRELILCCRLYTQSRLPSIQTMDELIAIYGQDPVSAPVPIEIVRCLDDLTWRGRLKGKTLIRWFRLLQDLLNVSGNSENSSLKPAMSRLKETVRQTIA